MSVRLVYYGPALSGKTSNLQALFDRLDPRRRGHLLTLDTKDDRTLFFDLLPLSVKSSTGVTVKVKLFTVPGQVIHNSTRRLVLQGCDGVVFVADSRIAETQGNNESFVNLKQNLRENGIDPAHTPIVIQFNKRDLPGIRSDAALAKLAERGKEPVYPAVAIRGEGVVETFLGLVDAVWVSLDQKLGLGTTHGVRRDELIAQLASQLGVPPVVPPGLGGQR
ncbi:MAG: GTPase domain-containing protein [Polyangia bacterium]